MRDGNLDMDKITLDGDQVVSLPMRDGNAPSTTSHFGEPDVVSLPMRDGNPPPIHPATHRPAGC